MKKEFISYQIYSGFKYQTFKYPYRVIRLEAAVDWFRSLRSMDVEIGKIEKLTKDKDKQTWVKINRELTGDLTFRKVIIDCQLKG